MNGMGLRKRADNPKPVLLKEEVKDYEPKVN